MLSFRATCARLVLNFVRMLQWMRRVGSSIHWTGHTLCPVIAERAVFLARATQPRVVEALIGGKAVTWSDLQKPKNEILGTFRNTLPRLFGKAEIPLHNLAVKFVEHVVEERERAAEDHVAYDANRPNVNLASILFLLDDLWCEIEIGATD